MGEWAGGSLVDVVHRKHTHGLWDSYLPHLPNVLQDEFVRAGIKLRGGYAHAGAATASTSAASAAAAAFALRGVCESESLGDGGGGGGAGGGPLVGGGGVLREGKHAHLFAGGRRREGGVRECR